MRLRYPLGAAVALLAALTPTAAAQPAPGADLGWVRLGHLSPKAPPVDIYLAAFGGPEQVVVRKAGYGAVTPYSALKPGAYTVAMRPADAGPETPPALSATVEIARGTAYSLLVFATGPDGALRGDLVIDDLTAPAPGTGRLRVVQGATAEVTAEVGTGPALADGAAYGMTTPYAQLAQGRYPLRLRGGSADSVAASVAEVDVRPGTSTTLLVTESGGALTAKPLTDSAGPATTPLLGVETGGGGTAPDNSPTWLLGVLPVAALAAWALGRRVA
ncbi:DUF4397 domain-containing protein [Actinokineospora sp. NBRC 105648]|uniref:DUF4397 domain-containing protein n=1 Tax=Actinokineospora sp. NBRC 105648 TaxID=3032206 RepID=UPI0024A192C9|nr:DUF4397 domain-containing protein [Actinokineospora sp. NBRC 105648]GLZ42151.1 peptidase [Actinokineospora sp. NBRC 105648]